MLHKAQIFSNDKVISHLLMLQIVTRYNKVMTYEVAKLGVQTRLVLAQVVTIIRICVYEY